MKGSQTLFRVAPGSGTVRSSRPWAMRQAAVSTVILFLLSLQCVSVHGCAAICSEFPSLRQPLEAAVVGGGKRARAILGVDPVVGALEARVASNITFRCELCRALWAARQATTGANSREGLDGGLEWMLF
jgi:hypothetical protein